MGISLPRGIVSPTGSVPSLRIIPLSRCHVSFWLPCKVKTPPTFFKKALPEVRDLPPTAICPLLPLLQGNDIKISAAKCLTFVAPGKEQPLYLLESTSEMDFNKGGVYSFMFWGWWSDLKPYLALCHTRGSSKESGMNCSQGFFFPWREALSLFHPFYITKQLFYPQTIAEWPGFKSLSCT